MTLRAWIDPADDNARADDGTNISAIADKSIGNANDVAQAVAGNQPLLGSIVSKSVLDVPPDKLRALVQGANYNLTGNDVTVIIAYTDDGSTAAGTLGEVLAQAGANGTGNGWRVYKATAGNQVGIGAQASGNLALVAGGASMGAIDIVACRAVLSGGWLEIIKNGGVAIGSDNITATLSVAHALAVANNPGLADGWASGKIADVVVVQGVLPYDEIQRIEGYLANKWAANSILPAGHPFKTQAPDVVRDAEIVASFDGVDEDTTYTAETGQALTFLGTAKLDNAQVRYGPTSLLVNGNAGRAEFAHATSQLLGAAAFTIEFWCNQPNVAGNNNVVSKWDTTGNQRHFIIRMIGGTGISVFYSTNGTTTSTLFSAIAFTHANNTWHHVEWAFDGTTHYLFGDGVLLATSTTTFTFHASNVPISFGDEQTLVAGDGFVGSVDGFRYLPGECLHTRDFDVPHRSPILPVTADMIANFNGANAAAAYTTEDATARALTFFGNAALSNASERWGYTGLSLDGAGDYVQLPSSVDFQFTGDFTWEARIRPQNLTNNFQGLFASDAPGFNAASLGILVFGSLVTPASNQGKFAITGGSGSGLATPEMVSTTALVVGTWYDLAICRVGTTLYLFVDGVLEAQVTNSNTLDFNNAGGVRIGSQRWDAGNGYFAGDIDSMRVLKGVGLYTADFTVPPLGFGDPVV